MNQARIEAEKDSMMTNASSAAASTLTEFAEKQAPSQRRCFVCRLPVEVEQQLREGKAAGVTYRVIGEWLASIGLADPKNPPKQSKLQRHLQDGHTHPDRKSE